jgi:hypothetical protein
VLRAVCDRRPPPDRKQSFNTTTSNSNLGSKEKLVSSNRVFNGINVSFFAVSVLFLSVAVSGQVPLSVDAGKSLLNRPMAVAERNNLYCAGYVQTAPINPSMEIVGGHEEQEQYLYSQNNVVYINAGENKGLKKGDVLSVFRPKGKVSSKFSKKGNLGFFVQEVGAVEVLRVQGEVSVARVKTSCDNFLLGDLVQPMEARVSPTFSSRAPLDRYAESNGKAVGRLFMARDGAEMLTRDNIVYVDLGAEDDVKVGDYLTVFRPLGKGNIFTPKDSETVAPSSFGFESETYKGGQFSNQASRRTGDQAGGRTESQKDAKGLRPSGLRKVVGELVVLNVRERTATAVVVRTGQEVHTGDYVEVQ